MFSLWDLLLVFLLLIFRELLRYRSGSFFQWYDKRKYKRRFKKFYAPKPPIPDPKYDNVLHLFHGKEDGPNNHYIDYTLSFVYTADRNPSKKPDILADLRRENPFEKFPDACFDQILVPNCVCCTQDIALLQGATFFKNLVRLLKPRGKLYVRFPEAFLKGLEPVTLDLLNESGLRDYTGGYFGKCRHLDWVTLIKEPSLPLITPPPVQEAEEKVPNVAEAYGSSYHPGDVVIKRPVCHHEEVPSWDF